MQKILIYGTRWCGDCIRAKMFVERAGLEYEYIDIDTSPELVALVIDYNVKLGIGPKRRIPIVLIGDQAYSEPTNDELAAALGLPS